MKFSNSNKTKARIAGVLFLFVIVFGAFAEVFVRQKVMVDGDAAKTAQNIIAHKWLFQVGIVSDLIMATAYFLFAFTTYHLLKSVNVKHAQVMLLSVVIAVCILCLNTFNQVAASLIINNDQYLKAFETDQLQALATFFMKLHSKGYMIAQIFYGLYLIPLGYLVYKSGVLPKIIGVCLILGGAGDLIDFVRFFLFPNYQSVILQNITVPANLGEFSLCLWLIVVGVNESKKSLDDSLTPNPIEFLEKA